jgi:hypothetical protein
MTGKNQMMEDGPEKDALIEALTTPIQRFRPDYEQCAHDQHHYLTRIDSLLMHLHQPYELQLHEIRQLVAEGLTSFAVNVAGVDDPFYLPTSYASYDLSDDKQEE